MHNSDELKCLIIIYLEKNFDNYNLFIKIIIINSKKEKFSNKDSNTSRNRIQKSTEIL